MPNWLQISQMTVLHAAAMVTLSVAAVLAICLLLAAVVAGWRK